MKKLMFLAASAAMMLASCTEKMDFTQADLQNAANPSNEVQFGTYMGRTATTRSYLGGYTGGPLTNKTTGSGATDLKDVGFGVFAYNSAYQKIQPWGNWDATTNTINKAPNFMYNEKLTWNSTNSYWEYSPVKYWPNGIDAANAAGKPSNTATEQGAQYLSFFAYAPYVEAKSSTYTGTKGTGVTEAVNTDETYGITAMSKNTETADMQLRYIHNGQADELHTVDLLWGLRGKSTYQETDGDDNNEATLGSAYNTDLTKQIVGEKVKFLFKHALSRVGGSTNSTTSASGSQLCGVKVVVDVDKNSNEAGTGQSNQNTYFSTDFNNAKTLVTIKSVKIRDQYTYSQEPGTTITTTKSDFATEGWFNIMKGTWTQSAADYTTKTNGITYSVTADNSQSVDNSAPFALNTDIKEPTSGVTKSNISGGSWSISGTTGVNTGAAKNLFADENVPGLLLIPGTNNNTLYVTVDYFVRTADDKLTNGFSEVEQVITNKVVLDGSILDPNKYYTLVMHLGLTSVKFEAVVADWSLTDGTYDEDGKETTGSGDNQQSVWLPSNVVESVSSAVTVTAGQNVSVSIPASKTSYKINLTHTGTLTVEGIFTDEACSTAASDGSTAVLDGSAVNVTIAAANTTSKNKVYYVKVTDSSDGSSVITITQKAAEIGIAKTYLPDLSAEKMTSAATTITLTITDAASSSIDLTDASNSYVIYASDGTTNGTVTATATGATIAIPANDTGAERTFTISVKVNDAPVQVFKISQVNS